MQRADVDEGLCAHVRARVPARCVHTLAEHKDGESELELHGLQCDGEG